LLKIGLVALMIFFGIVVLALMVQSFKYLRRVEKQEAAEKKNSQPERQLHPKLQQKNKDKH
jgi:flagellar basal body-associated protein FliL